MFQKRIDVEREDYHKTGDGGNAWFLDIEG